MEDIAAAANVTVAANAVASQQHDMNTSPSVAKSRGALNRLGSARNMQACDNNKGSLTSDKARVVQVTKAGHLREVVGSEATFSSLFMSGLPARVVPAGKSLEEVEDTMQKGGNRLSQITAADMSYNELPEVIFFPDPPCILPFDGQGQPEDEDCAVDVEPQGHPQSYWKSFTHPDEGTHPELALQRQANERFIREWLDVGETTDTQGQVVNPEDTAGQMVYDLKAFVNTSAKDLDTLQNPSVSVTVTAQRVLIPGECVLVKQAMEKDEARYLELSDGSGWLTEQRGVVAELRNIEIGSWWHKVICQEALFIRKAPIYDASVRSAHIASPGELLVVDLKCSVRGWKFVRLADGRGWLFVMRPGIRKDNTDLSNTCLKDVNQEIVHGTRKVNLKGFLPATNKAVEVGSWYYAVMKQPVLAIGERIFGTYLSPGEVVKVDKRAYCNGDEPSKYGERQVMWLHLKDNRGWVAQVANGVPQLIVIDSGKTNPAWYKGEQAFDDGNDDLVGFV